MDPDILMLFDRLPGALPIYLAAEEKILTAFPQATRKVSKTQVGFSGRYGFAFLWPPTRRIKGRPGVYVVLTFGLGRRAEHPRIVEAVEPYPGRWTHHVLISRADELDDQVMAWLNEAWQFSQSKGRRPRQAR